MKARAAGAVVACVLLGLGWARAEGQSAAERAALQAAEDKYTEGVLMGDAKELASVWDDNFVDTDEQGHMADKQQQLANILGSKTKILNYKVEDEHVDFYGSTAVITQRFHIVYAANGAKAEETGRSTDVWVRQHGKWLCVAAHASAVPPPPQPPPPPPPPPPSK